MSKLFKKVSALVLAGAMTLSSSVAVFAANMTVYYRTYDGENTYENYGSEVITGVDSSMSIYQALKDYYKGRADWTSGIADDGITDYYLDALTLKGQTEAWKTDGKYTYLEEDYSHGTWVGTSWMWYEGNDLTNTKYPETSLSRARCKDSDFSIVLSYDTQVVNW